MTPVRTHIKVVFFALISIFGTVAYFFTLRATRIPATIVPATAIDAFIPFVPWFLVAYISFFVFMPLPLVLIRHLEEFIPSAFGFFFIMAFSNLIFFFWPTSIPSGGPYDPLLHGLLTVDRNRNACPSLHASLALYCALVMHSHLTKRTPWLVIMWLWALVIMASPLLIKRHMFIDIAAGSVLAAIVFAFVRRRQRSLAIL